MQHLSTQQNQELTETERAICALLSEGKTLVEVHRELGLSLSMMWRMRQAKPAFDSAVMRAREQGSEALGDVLLHLHETIPDPKRAAVASNNYRFFLERRHRRTWGASLDVTASVQVDLGGALAAAKARALRPMSDLTPVLDVEFEALPSPQDARPPDSQSDSAQTPTAAEPVEAPQGGASLEPDIFS